MTRNNKASLYEALRWNELNLDLFTTINWRASLVPAAAVIPAPIAYIKVVAVKKLVVGFRNRPIGPSSGSCTDRSVLLREDRVCP